MRRNKVNIGTAVVAVLVVIGLGSSLARNPFSLLLPAVILGGIFAFYWFSPARRKRAVKPSPRHAGKGRGEPSRFKSASAKARGRKPSPFRVIDGGKDEDGMPKYH
ncbi:MULTISPECIES: hypothetical protein [Paenibacillus]|uniref:hypothetical protein n=1 Tax=Paenibacillus TaxID=44249 RepID=UPI00038F40DF|nr:MULTISPECIES: hypothetical protein [Paenibacillus]KKC46162.1 hypothetical protein VE23_02070 [Paenibacillus sp. D9]CDN44933.1 hypothetical protein BN871_FY_00370 [Paenibacillus sp. P22]